MNDVLPSHLQSSPVGASVPRGTEFVGLAVGEVLGVVLPDDPKSISKTFAEYAVLVSHAANGVGATLIYPRCYLASSFGGIADYVEWTPRADPKAGLKGQPGTGSKVLVACLGGNRDSAFIVGGIRDARDDRQAEGFGDLGHHLAAAFNGVSVSVDNLGALVVQRDGPTKPDGTLDDGGDDEAAERTGAVVRLDADGGIEFATREEDGDATQRIKIDHKAKTISVAAEAGYAVEVHGPATIHAAKSVTIKVDDEGIRIEAAGGDVTVTAPAGKILLGDGADEPLVLGNQFKTYMETLLATIAGIIVSTAVGPSSPPLNAATFTGPLKAQLVSLLSQASFTKATP